MMSWRSLLAAWYSRDEGSERSSPTMIPQITETQRNPSMKNSACTHSNNSSIFFLAQAKMSWHTLLTLHADSV